MNLKSIKPKMTVMALVVASIISLELYLGWLKVTHNTPHYLEFIVDFLEAVDRITPEYVRGFLPVIIFACVLGYGMGRNNWEKIKLIVFGLVCIYVFFRVLTVGMIAWDLSI